MYSEAFLVILHEGSGYYDERRRIRSFDGAV